MRYTQFDGEPILSNFPWKSRPRELFLKSLKFVGRGNCQGTLLSILLETLSMDGPLSISIMDLPLHEQPNLLILFSVFIIIFRLGRWLGYGAIHTCWQGWQAIWKRLNWWQGIKVYSFHINQLEVKFSLMKILFALSFLASYISFCLYCSNLAGPFRCFGANDDLLSFSVARLRHI